MSAKASPLPVRTTALAALLVAGLLGVAPSPESPVPAAAAPAAAADPALAAIAVPAGFTVQRVAGPPLVDRPIMACLDDRGRLFVADSAGVNLPAEKLLADPPHCVRLLEDTDGDGVYDKSTVFADKMVFPQGALWHDGSLYVCSPPYLWRLTDTDGDGVADKREKVVGDFGFTGNAADLHGPFLGPDGWLYWCDGRHGHKIKRPDGSTMTGKASYLFRCRPDGRDVEIVCGGGMDNPVEIAFTPEGEPLATCNLFESRPKRVDAILYGIDGAAFPWHDYLSELKRTGDLMPPAGEIGWVALSGFMRYRGTAFGPEYANAWFTAQFNPHKVQRHVIDRDGAGFRVKRSEDFFVSTNPDSHPTDVLEDADGSLLVVDTGGWFRIGCPNSRIAKPEVMGGIYRVRRTGAPKVDDPRGLKLTWDGATPKDLIERLYDPRPAVVERASAALGKAGDAAVPELTRWACDAWTRLDFRERAVWALTRVDTPVARAGVRSALDTPSPRVRQVAARSAGLGRDGQAAAGLLTALKDDDPALVREAATALGRIGKADSVPRLLETLRRPHDRFVEHALIWALIQIHDPTPTRKGLADADPVVRTGAMIALDQMDGGGLTPAEVLPLLDPAQPDIRQAALWVISHHADWGKAMLDFFRAELARPNPDDRQREAVRQQLAAFAGDPAVRGLVAQFLNDPNAPAAARLVLLEAAADAPLDRLPDEWADGLARALTDADERVVRQAVLAIRAFPPKPATKSADPKKPTTKPAAPPPPDLGGPLLAVAADDARPDDLRALAAAVAAPRVDRLGQPVFRFLVACLDAGRPSLLRSTAADALGRAKPDDDQLAALAPLLAKAGPLEAPKLLPAFARPGVPDGVGRDLVAALEKSPGIKSLRPDDLRRALADYPEDVRQSADPLLRRLAPDADKQKARLAELQPALAGGEASRGRELFFGNKAACSTCHTVAGRGGRVGPDLSKIGSIRAGPDLLESIVFPSASFARGYEPVVVKTKDGDAVAGIVGRETADAVYVYNGQRVETRISRSNVADVRPDAVSIMPEGLDAQLGRQDLADLIAFLQSLK